MTAETLESELRRDLAKLGDRFADEKFSTELYRALTNNAWHKDGHQGHVALSWRRAEEIVNELRGDHHAEPLTLAQTGGEGEVAGTVAGELAGIGWRSHPLNTGRHDDAHVSQPEESPPPQDATAPEWEREAHEEADQAQSRP